MGAGDQVPLPGGDGRSYRLVSALGRGGFGSVYRGELRGAGGGMHPSGELPVGTYTALVAFPGGATIELPGLVTVTAGQTTTLRCDAVAQACR